MLIGREIPGSAGQARRVVGLPACALDLRNGVRLQSGPFDRPATAKPTALPEDRSLGIGHAARGLDCRISCSAGFVPAGLESYAPPGDFPSAHYLLFNLLFTLPLVHGIAVWTIAKRPAATLAFPARWHRACEGAAIGGRRRTGVGAMAESPVGTRDRGHDVGGTAEGRPRRRQTDRAGDRKRLPRPSVHFTRVATPVRLPAIAPSPPDPSPPDPT